MSRSSIPARLRGAARYRWTAAVGRCGDRIPALYRWDARREAARLAAALSAADTAAFRAFEARRHSQNGEDGVLAEVFRRLGVAPGFFVEIGASDGSENCTRALLEDGWSGIWVEADTGRATTGAGVSERVVVLARAAGRGSVASMLGSAGCPAEPDLLVVDIDSDDLGVAEGALASLRPAVVVVEYNPVFRPGEVWARGAAAGGWDLTFRHGASLSALDGALAARGYRLFHCDAAGVNAFFVRDDLVDRLGLGPVPDPVDALYRPAAFSIHPFGHVRSRRAVAPMPALEPEHLRLVTLVDGRVEALHPLTGGERPRALVVFSVAVVNGTREALRSGGEHAVNLAVRHLGEDGGRYAVAARGNLPVTVPPGASRRLVLWTIVEGPGATVRVTVLQEQVFWREDLGGPGAWVDLTVRVA